YSTTPGVSYDVMPNVFSTTGGTSHSTIVTGLTDGQVYNYYCRCSNAAGNANTSDYVISFGVGVAPQKSGIVAAYSFNEGTGTTAADASGNSNTGTLAGPSWLAQGKFGSALSFSGSGFVTINDSTSLHLTNGMTLEAWVSPTTAPGGWQDIIYKANDMYYLEGSSTQGGVPAMGGTFSPNPLYGTATLPINTWSHLAATYDGATMRLFVNGVQVASFAQTGPIQTSTQALSIGGDAIYGQYWAGVIDEVRIYNRALSQAEIQSDMNIPIGEARDTTPPVISNGQPTGTLPAGTTQATLSLATDENATCKYATTTGTPDASMPNVFSTTGGTSHSTAVSGLTGGQTYKYYCRCSDALGNVDGSDYLITFSVATAAAAPTVSSVAPNTGSTAGGTSVTITATNFVSRATASF